MKKEKMPVVFVGHGNPMNAIETNSFTEKWKELGREMPKPEAIVCISAHWETKGTFVTGMEYPKTIHDFGGFPKELFEVQYPAKGNLELAKKIVETVKSRNIGIDTSNWGLDHGTWSVLVHMYPEAEVPVVQLSLDHFATPEQHYRLAKELATLREEGILFVCSGNIIHNLRTVDWSNYENRYEWAKTASETIKSHLWNNELEALLDIENAREDMALSINSAEHYIPLLYLLGLKTAFDSLSFFNDEIIMGSLSMTGVLLK